MDSARKLLSAAYEELGFAQGSLLEATGEAREASATDWITKGDWLALADSIGAERVFFVEENPVVVFAELRDEDGAWARAFNESWCMARPQLLFLASPGELAVYDLTREPTRRHDSQARSQRLLAVAKSASDVQSKLHKFRRSQIESGKLYEEHRFGFDTRADRALIRDLKELRRVLQNGGLSDHEHVHALIGRSIFVRYLEDRGVLSDDYYRSVAEERPAWRRLVKDAIDGLPDNDHEPRSLYTAVLDNDEAASTMCKSFVYDGLFKHLDKDFNGDMFRSDASEQASVSPQHLKTVQRFLRGDVRHDRLFFFAYRFNIVPIELISSIYEEFYNVEQGKSNNNGSFYTPSTLVEFVCSQVLTPEVLESQPRILDPACGSGIFLVEAFRRIVRYRTRKQGRRLSADQLRAILRKQIAGIDINPEAVRVAAFSLYLAMLHYRRPQDILQSDPLPSLTYDPKRETFDPEQHYNTLLPANTFDLAAVVKHEDVLDEFAGSSFDVVVGNPPWGDPSSAKDPATRGKRRAMNWCGSKGLSVGDKELSQAFVHRCVDLLKDGGLAGLLLSTGVFFKRHAKSQEFREQWLRRTTLKHVVNFAATREYFFSGKGRKSDAIAPFASVVFRNSPPSNRSQFEYWSAKKTFVVQNTQAIVLASTDLKRLQQYAVVKDEELWKVYWWGSHRDEALVQALRIEPTLISQLKNGEPDKRLVSTGYKEVSKDVESDWLCEFKELPADALERYGPLDSQRFVDPPADGVERLRFRELYEGPRILIGRGVRQKGGANGKIVARFESQPLCFRNSIYGVRLLGDSQNEARVILGILWSSLVRYYFWMTSGAWAGWHYEILQPTVKSIPVRLPNDNGTRRKIESIVSKLQEFDTQDVGSLFGKWSTEDAMKRALRKLEEELDDAIFDLYELTEGERDLVRDACNVGLELFYRGVDSEALKSFEPAAADEIGCGRASDLPKRGKWRNTVAGYLDAFLDVWNPELEPNGEFRWRIIRPAGIPMLAIAFESEGTSSRLPPSSSDDAYSWSGILERIDNDNRQPFGSRRIYLEGLARIVTEHDIVIIKRNERRLWTRSAAREDAEATLAQVISRQEVAK